MSKLKKGKAASDDMISNQLLMSLNHDNIVLLTELFKICLDKGVYPWNNNIITPLHKKGCKDNPDNYKAISVSSEIGKLLSPILLDRFIKSGRVLARTHLINQVLLKNHRLLITF